MFFLKFLKIILYPNFGENGRQDALRKPSLRVPVTHRGETAPHEGHPDTHGKQKNGRGPPRCVALSISTYGGIKMLVPRQV